VFDNPQIKHLGIPKQIEHPKMGTSNLVGSPINMSGTPPMFFRAAPLLGENTVEVLARLGYSETAMKELRASKVIEIS
jgi:formyl-CoA transferase